MLTRETIISILCFAICVCAAESATYSAEKKAEAPSKVESGILFRFYSPSAKVVYLAGSFNNWGENDNGVVSNPVYAMENSGNGVWSKTVQLNPGKYAFKYVVNGNDWHPDPNISAKDKDNNSVIYITKTGNAVAGGKNPELLPHKTKAGYLFQFAAPDANIVYLAGSFNNWADNDNGLVTDPACAMQDFDGDGVWSITLPLKPGRYAFRYVVDGDLWSADPNIAELDKDGNSVLTIAE